MPRKKANEIVPTERSKNVTEYHYVRYDDSGKEVSRTKTYAIDSRKGLIRFFPARMSLKEIELPSCTSLPAAMFDERGFLKDGLGSFFEYRFNKAGLNAQKLVVEVGIQNRLESKESGSVIYLNFKDLQNLQKRIKMIRHQSRLDLGAEFDVFLHEHFPEAFSAPRDRSGGMTRKINQVFSNLDEDIISHLDRSHIDSFVEFFTDIIEKRYKSESHKKKLLSLARVKINSVPLKELISEYKKYLDEDASEHQWSKFLQRNLFLIDPSYIHAFKEIHLTLGATSRKADFGLVDIKNFLDIFEIKRPSTKLLAAGEDRGNHYWHSDATKAIVQAEKYLFNAEKSALVLASDLTKETGIEINVIRPKVILLIGNTQQLDTKKKKDDFRILRNSLKNIEIVLYDELYEKLKLLEEGSIFAD